MVYCRECGEQIEDSDIYCWNCGTHLEKETDSRSVDERAEEFWSLIEGMIDREIERISKDPDLAVAPPLLDRVSFACRMYIIGLMKGRIGTILIEIADNAKDTEPTEVDFSPIYERIIDAVEAREDEIRDGLKKPDDQDIEL
jgi:hypothetical protein